MYNIYNKPFPSLFFSNVSLHRTELVDKQALVMLSLLLLVQSCSTQEHLIEENMIKQALSCGCKHVKIVTLICQNLRIRLKAKLQGYTPHGKDRYLMTWNSVDTKSNNRFFIRNTNKITSQYTSLASPATFARLLKINCNSGEISICCTVYKNHIVLYTVNN